jgi:hypothetical protein
MTTEQRLDALERELGRTKRVNRWLLAVICVIVVGALTGLTVAGQERRVPAELRARAFVLEDENGNTRVRLTTRKSGGAVLAMLDANGNPGAFLEMRMDGSAALLSVMDAHGSVRVGVTLDNDITGLSLHDASGPRVILTVDKNGPDLVLHDANGTPRLGLSQDKDGSRLSLADANRTPRLRLSAEEDPQMILWDANGKSFWTTPSKRMP